MGTADSKLGDPQYNPSDEITTVKSPIQQQADSSLEKLKSLRIAPPLLKYPPPESTLSDILVRKGSASTSDSGSQDSKVILELFSMYRDWQEHTVKKINQNQEELENKIEIADALAVKLLQRISDSVSDMKTGVSYLEDVYPLQVEVGELKGKLKEVIANCNALSDRIDDEGLDVMKGVIKPSCLNDKSSNFPDVEIGEYKGMYN